MEMAYTSAKMIDVTVSVVTVGMNALKAAKV
jgi:hypothetical protein